MHSISLQYNDLGRAEILNLQNYGIIPTGFTTAPTLSIINNTTVQVTTFTAYIKDSVKKLSVRIENDAAENIPISSSAPYAIIRLTWANSVSNDFIYTNVAVGDLLSTDLIICKGNYTGPTLSSLDTSVQSLNILKDNGTLISKISYQTTSDPTSNNDGVDTAAIGRRFSIGDRWINTSTNQQFSCTSVATGAAIWRRISSDQTLDTTSTPSFTGIYNKSGSDFRLYETDNTHYVGFKAPTLSANKIWTLPTADGTANQLLGTDGAGNFNWFTSGSTVFPFLPTTGLIMSNNSSDLTNDIDFTAGKAVDSTNAYIISVSALTKRLDATFVAGTNAGMLDTGAKANSTIYYIYTIGKTTDSTAGDILASTNATTPSMPATWDLYKQIRVIKTDQNGVVWLIDNRNDLDTGIKVSETYSSSSVQANADNIYFFMIMNHTNTTITGIKFRSVSSTVTIGKKICYAIYSDSGANAPSTLLSQTQALTVQASDKDVDNDIILYLRSRVSLSANTKYWIAIWSDGQCNWTSAPNSYTGRYKYKSSAYTGTFPSSAGSMTGDAGGYIPCQLF